MTRYISASSPGVMNLEHSGRISCGKGIVRNPGQNRSGIKWAITYLEHESRGERGEYEITYIDKRC